MTKRVSKTGELVGIQLLDSVVLGESSHISMKEIDVF
ncbi:TPA: hypothetical protein PI220_002255 [Staphylococcus aureus]|nr:hypothetical protein [Staphylococcus aureus]HDH4520409.1 hypothetical protein [Staphylococcus aureus]HDH4617691.1 hypothetical protein [Staphylococcus aureus]